MATKKIQEKANDTSSPTLTQSSSYRTLPPSLYGALEASYPAYRYLMDWCTQWTRSIDSAQFSGVSPWDSVVQGGDATWEGIPVYRGKILSLDQHLRRLFQSAKALGFEPKHMHTKEEVREAIFQTLAANGMRDGGHMRLTLTRGEKYTSSMNPLFNVYGSTLIILPEWKPTSGGVTTYDNTKGIALISASQRRNSPLTVDSKIHHNNLINNILPKFKPMWPAVPMRSCSMWMGMSVKPMLPICSWSIITVSC